MDETEFVARWNWTRHPCWLWVTSCHEDHVHFTQMVVQHVLSRGDHNPQGGDDEAVRRGLKNGFYPNWTRVSLPSDASMIPIESVRELFQNIVYKAPLPGWRVVVVEGSLNTYASNALLKTLEEPPPETLWLLWATHMGQVLPTLRSRCQVVHLPQRVATKDLHPLAWGSSDWDQKLHDWGRLEAVERLLDAPVMDTSVLKTLWDQCDAWFVLDVYQRLAYARAISQPSASMVERWHELARWFRQSKAAHLDPAHTLIEGMRLLR